MKYTEYVKSLLCVNVQFENQSYEFVNVTRQKWHEFVNHLAITGGEDNIVVGLLPQKTLLTLQRFPEVVSQ